MSLRIFHIVFLVCSILLLVGFAFWAWKAGMTAWSGISVAAVASLLIYGMNLKRLHI